MNACVNRVYSGTRSPMERNIRQNRMPRGAKMPIAHLESEAVQVMDGLRYLGFGIVQKQI